MKRRLPRARFSLSSLLSDVRDSWSTAPHDMEVRVVSVDNDGASSSKDNMEKESSAAIDEDPFEHVSEGRINELERLIKSSPSALNAVDDCGRSLMHVAVDLGQTAMIELLHANGLDMNCIDDDGNTPLHVAAQKDDPGAVDVLCRLGADSKLLNVDNKAPVHVACLNNCARSLETLLQFRPDDVNLCGERGFTPGHYCALNDSVEAYLVMNNFGKLVCRGDWTGLYPIHIAIKNVSVRFLSTIIQDAETLRGQSPSTLMNMKDADGNVALHFAVNTGDERCVLLCLENGGDISVQQEDNSTPLHYACTKGELDLVKLMLKKQPEQFQRVIDLKDNNGRTPLHESAFFNHVKITRFMVEQGADIEATDTFQRTPLLLAAFNNSIDVCVSLMELGADCGCVDVNGRNIFHLLILGSNASCSRVKSIPRFQHLKRLVNDRDVYGCSPLHYATKKGLVTSTDYFLGMGADCYVQNNEDDTPLHFAARFGRINTCQKLLDSGGGGRILNCMDSKGYLPIHAAAENGHTKTLQLLLDRGSIFQKTFEGDTPLHLATANGHLSTVEVLLTINPSLLNAVNKMGRTALHNAAVNNRAEVVEFLLSQGAELGLDEAGESFISLAISHRRVEVAQVVVRHERWQELLLSVQSLGRRCPVIGFVSEMPDLAAMVLDRCMWTVGDYKTHDYHINYDFSILNGRTVEDSLNMAPLGPIRLMVDLNRVELLQHPVCVAFLTHKWYAYGKWLHIGNMLLYCVFIVTLTIHVWRLDALRHVDNRGPDECRMRRMHSPSSLVNDIVLETLVIVNMIKEFVQLYQQSSRYFTDVSNYSEWAMYLSVTVMVVPRFIYTDNRHFQMEAAAVATLIAYVNLLLFFKRFEMFGIYVVMFIEIAQTLLKAIMLFIILIVGFSFSFYLLLRYPFEKLSLDPEEWPYCYTTPNETRIASGALEAWSTPTLAFLKTFMMMVGEYDYLATFVNTSTDDNYMTNHFSYLTFTLLLLFIFFVPILLMNLLIGLAVGDIETVRRNAALKRIAMQVEWYAELESKMPVFIRRMLYSSSWVSYPYCAMSSIASANKGLFNLFSICRMKTYAHASFEPALADDKVSEELEERKRQIVVRPVSNNRTDRFLQQQQDKIVKIEDQLETQTNLLKLIMQKMEIHTEAEEKDEGMDLRHKDELLPAQVIYKWKRLQTSRTLCNPRSEEPPPAADSLSKEDMSLIINA